MSLVRAGSKGDNAMFRRSLEAMVAEERAKNHNVLADRLAEYLTSNGVHDSGTQLAGGNGGVENYLYQTMPELGLKDLVLPMQVVGVIERVIEEQTRRELLRSEGLEPRHRLLLVGPPGNGKTSLAEAIAFELMVPLLVVRYESIIGSFLGETGQRLRKAIEYARSRHCVLFFDEFDAIAKERGDTHETGEIKRVVSSLLMQIDDLPSHVVVVTASNHPELLDRAVWRRFQVRLELPPPSPRHVEDWMRRLGDQVKFDVTATMPSLLREFRGASFSDLELFRENVLRAMALEGVDADAGRVLRRCVDERRAQFVLKPSSPTTKRRAE